jgi:DNA-binding response OmpR family regulator
MPKILVTEGDKFLANAYRVKLSKSNFEVKIASNGEDALTILQTFTPDLILLDLVMPKKDGFTVLKELQAKPHLKGIPVLVASNLGQKEDLDKAMALGAKSYVVKSDMSLENLIKKINSIIGKSSTSAPPVISESAPTNP